MTPEERARQLMFEARCPHGDLGRGEIRDPVDCVECTSAMIRAAIAEEREACAKLLDDSCTYSNDPGVGFFGPECPEAWPHEMARRLRARP